MAAKKDDIVILEERRERAAVAKINDLRSALELLEKMPGQLVQTDTEVDPMGELSGVYRHVGGGRYGAASDKGRTGNDF